MKKQTTYGVGFFLWLKLFLLRFKARTDAKNQQRVERRLTSAYEAVMAKLALIGKSFVETNEAILKLCSTSEPTTIEIPKLDVNSRDSSIVEQKKEIASATAAQKAREQAQKANEEALKQLEVKKVALQDAFSSLFTWSKVYTDSYLVRIEPLDEDFVNPFDKVPSIFDFIELKKGVDTHEIFEKSK